MVARLKNSRAGFATLHLNIHTDKLVERVKAAEEEVIMLDTVCMMLRDRLDIREAEILVGGYMLGAHAGTYDDACAAGVTLCQQRPPTGPQPTDHAAQPRA